MKVAALAVAAVLLAAGCSSSGGSQADDPVVSRPPVSTPSTQTTLEVVGPTPTISAPTSVPSTPAAPSDVTPSTTPPTPAHSTHVTAPPIVQRSSCTKLTIRAIPGGASVGQEIAALQFTNDGSTPCELFGYPTVTLLRAGKPLGRPSQPASTALSHRTLAPGDTAESLLRDYVGNCQAPLSDAIRVVAPGSTQSLSRPFVLRVCVLRTDRLGAPD